MTETKTAVPAVPAAPVAATHSWQKAAKTSLYLAVFLLPLFFLPWVSNIFDFSKQMILTVLVCVGLFAWLLKSLIEEKITLNFSWINIAVISFVLVVLASTLFSAYKYASLWGWPLVVSSSFLATLVLAGFFFLITHIFRDAKEIFGLVLILSVAGLLVGLFAIPGIFGKSLIASESNFNTVGSVNSLAFFLASILPLAASIIFVSKAKLVKVLIWTFISVALALLLIINSQTAWIILMLASVVILTFAIARKGLFKTGWLFLPMFLLAVSLFAVVSKNSLLPMVNLPLEVSPSFKSSFDIAFKAVAESNKPVSWFLGSGPSTFVYDYSQFRPLDINQTVFWNTRFGVGFSEFATRLATTGTLGLLSFLVIVFGIGFIGLKEIIVRRAEDEETFSWMLLLGAFASFIGIVAGFFLYTANMTLMFCFWLIAAIIFSLVGSKSKDLVLQSKEKASSWITVGVSFVFIVVVISSLGILFTQGQRFLGEINHTKALASVAKGDNAGAINSIARAINLTSSKQDNYWQDLSQVYLFRINEELQKTDVTQEEMTSTVSNLISQLVSSAKAMTDASPKNVTNWLTRGLVYSNLVNLINGADEWAIKSYEEAVKLEPLNPITYTQWGLIYLNRADALTD
ncbi:MAG: hypothetical protein Q8N56_01355, partial [bacterium]|nr:hypothetical protein [bacterium]